MAGNKKSPQRQPQKSSRDAASKQNGHLLNIISEQLINPFGQMLKTNYQNQKISMSIGVILIFVALFSAMACLSFLFTGGTDQDLLTATLIDDSTNNYSNIFGPIGARLSNFLFNKAFGFGIFILLLYIGRLGWGMLLKKENKNIFRTIIRLSISFMWMYLTAILLTIIQTKLLGSWETFLILGGRMGKSVTLSFLHSVGLSGLILILIFAGLILSIFTNINLIQSIRNFSLPRWSFSGIGFPSLGKSLWRKSEVSAEDTDEDEDDEDDEDDYDDEGDEDDEVYVNDRPEDEDEEVIEVVEVIRPTPTPPSPEPLIAPHSAPEPQPAAETNGLTIETAPEDELVEVVHTNTFTPGVMLEHYHQPPVELLIDHGSDHDGYDNEEIEANMRTIINTLKDFKKAAKPGKITVGPTVTLYEIIPDPGITMASIRNLADDISRTLKSDGSIRIIAPMPSTGTVGIEVPNSHPQTVSMRSIMASRRFNELKEKMDLPIGIGKTIMNEPFVFDLAKSPHLLIAGATGQGKSVGLNALIASLLYSKRPEELKFVMIDPKMLEFSIYEQLRNHFLANVPGADKSILTDMTEVVPTLNSLCVEMDNRYRILSENKVRNIKEYNSMVRSGQFKRIDGHELLPYIVLIIDEYADLVMVAGKEVEHPIIRLAQKARAAGIHIVIATQRPTVNVITGLIKANFPARIAFKVVQSKDSTTILDTVGANNLIGRGDMLYSNGGEPQRLQCAFLDTPECETIVNYIHDQESFGSPFLLPEFVVEGEGGGKTFNPNEKDPLFDDVARMIVQTQVGSTSNIQRKFNIGYNRAGRLMDQLEGAGIVGAQDGSKPREVFIQDQVSLEHLLSQL